MAHEIENLDVVGLRHQQAWHNLGIVVQENLTAVEAGERFGLFWPVVDWGLVARSKRGQEIWGQLRQAVIAGDKNEAIVLLGALEENQLAVDSHVANVRTEDCNGRPVVELLGVVGASYQVCQNRELAEFVDALATTGKVVIESCGSIRNGKRVWFLARGDAFEIGSGDKVFPYLCVSNGHDGTQSIRVTPTTVRVVCSNTLHMVIPRDDSFAGTAACSIRHTGKLANKLELAKAELARYSQVLDGNRKLYDRLQSTPFDQSQRLDLFTKSYAANWAVATAEELNSRDPKVKQTAERRYERQVNAAKAFLARFEREQKLLRLGETAWAAFNALSGFIQHDVAARGSDDLNRIESRQDSNLFGLNAQRTIEALSLTLAN